MHQNNLRNNYKSWKKDKKIYKMIVLKIWTCSHIDSTVEMCFSVSKVILLTSSAHENVKLINTSCRTQKVFYAAPQRKVSLWQFEATVVLYSMYAWLALWENNTRSKSELCIFAKDCCGVGSRMLESSRAVESAHRGSRAEQALAT